MGDPTTLEARLGKAEIATFRNISNSCYLLCSAKIYTSTIWIGRSYSVLFLVLVLLMVLLILVLLLLLAFFWCYQTMRYNFLSQCFQTTTEETLITDEWFTRILNMVTIDPSIEFAVHWYKCYNLGLHCIFFESVQSYQLFYL